ncbi:MAG: site-2 protease family protein [Anaerolineales bacterium]|nr:site-2 protease family protein [Anaerolineales bacterium]
MDNDINGPVVPLDKVEALRNSVTDLFSVTDTTLDQPHPGYVRFRGYFIVDSAQCFDDLRERFEKHGFTPMVRQEQGRIALIALPTVFAPKKSNWIINLLLLIATIASTLYLGATYDLNAGDKLNLWSGWPFSLSIMLILGAHELGHYFAARYHKVPVTLPYFLPLPPPFSLFGTLGAFIQLKAPVKNRRALLDVGVAGPLAGMVFALPILIYGLATSKVGPIGPPPTDGAILLEGNSILYALTKLAMFGRFLPDGNFDV